MHIIPVQGPPIDFEPLDTNWIDPGIATLDENPSGVIPFFVAMSWDTIFDMPILNPSQPPAK